MDSCVGVSCGKPIGWIKAAPLVSSSSGDAVKEALSVLPSDFHAFQLSLLSHGFDISPAFSGKKLTTQLLNSLEAQQSGEEKHNNLWLYMERMNRFNHPGSSFPVSAHQSNCTQAARLINIHFIWDASFAWTHSVTRKNCRGLPAAAISIWTWNSWESETWYLTRKHDRTSLHGVTWEGLLQKRHHT